MRRSLPLAALVLLLSACSDGDGNKTGRDAVTEPVAEPAAEPTATPGPAVTDLDSAEAAWKNAALDDYQFTLTEICFCDPAPPVVVIVKNDAVDSAFYKHNGVYLSAEEAALLPTVEGLFQRIHEAYEAEVASVEASYNSTRGYPEAVFIDYDEQFVDEEDGFEVTDFQ